MKLLPFFALTAVSEARKKKKGKTICLKKLFESGNDH